MELWGDAPDTDLGSLDEEQPIEDRGDSGGGAHFGGSAALTGGAAMTGGRPGSGGESWMFSGGMGGQGIDLDELCGEFSCESLGNCSIALTAEGTCVRRCEVSATLRTNDDVQALAALECDILESRLTIEGSEVSTLAGLETIRIIEGDLFVVEATELSDLTGLSGLQLVTQHLSIQSTELSNLAGLQSLTGIGAGLEIYRNWGLVDISALRGLTGEALTLYITGNPLLPTLEGLEGIISTKNCTIAANDKLVDIQGLDNLQTIDGSLVLATNPELLSLNLPSLRQIAGSLAMTGQGLAEQSDMLNLQAVGEDIVIFQNGLTVLPFGQLQSVRSLTITSNKNLLTLEGLANLQTVTQLQISENGALPQCEVNAFNARFGVCTDCSNNSDAICGE